MTRRQSWLSWALWSAWRTVPERWRLAAYLKMATPSGGGRLYTLPCGLRLKEVNDWDPQNEAAALRFVRDSTSIPVPQVYDLVHGKESGKSARAPTGWIVMDWIEGETLGAWFHRHVKIGEGFDRLKNIFVFGDRCDPEGEFAGDEGMMRLVAQMASVEKVVEWDRVEDVIRGVRGAIHELRSIRPPPNTGVSSLEGRPLNSWRLREKEVIPPFPDIDSFHEYILEGVLVESRKPRIRHMAERTWFKKEHRLCFTHGDLNLHNILIKDDKMVGIIDWETAGWLPEYWEWTQILRYHVATRGGPTGQLMERIALGLFDDRYKEEEKLAIAVGLSSGERIVPPGVLEGLWLDEPLRENEISHTP